MAFTKYSISLTAKKVEVAPNLFDLFVERMKSSDNQLPIYTDPELPDNTFVLVGTTKVGGIERQFKLKQTISPAPLAHPPA